MLETLSEMHTSRQNIKVNNYYLKGGVKMCLVPNFEMGLWNAWIFMLYHQLLCIVLLGSKGLLIKSSAATPHKKLGGKL